MKSSPAERVVWPRAVAIVPAFKTSVPISSTKPPPAVTDVGVLVVIRAPASTVTLPPASVKLGT